MRRSLSSFTEEVSGLLTSQRVTDVVPVKKFLLLIAILAGLVIASMSVLSDETPAQTSIQSATSGDTAGKFSGPGNDSPAVQQPTAA